MEVGKERSFCVNCGAELEPNAHFCHQCGVAAENEKPGQILSSDNRRPTKNVVAALLLSILLPGLGHLYLNDDKGYLLIVSSIIMIILGVFLLVPLLLFYIIFLYAALDAVRTADRINSGQE
ncbi:MAG TPA: zinc ribbon domain-containing protein [Candidatus Methanomethylophilaceae archaeon]|nr:zinc ribbon domain-containing protein [Candidatus Methanomethylophilaceae archaeon]